MFPTKSATFLGCPTVAPHQSPQVSSPLQLQDARVFLVPPSESFSCLILLSCLQARVLSSEFYGEAGSSQGVLGSQAGLQLSALLPLHPGYWNCVVASDTTQLRRQHHPPPPLPHFTSLSSIYSAGDPSLIKPDPPHPIFYWKLPPGLHVSVVLNGVYSWFVIPPNALFLGSTYCNCLQLQIGA